jgi:hypothetical protein
LGLNSVGQHGYVCSMLHIRSLEDHGYVKLHGELGSFLRSEYRYGGNLNLSNFLHLPGVLREPLEKILA